MTHSTDRSLRRPYGLRAEQRHEPLGLGESRLPSGRLTWARAEQETARGRFSCSTAVLEIPTPDPDSVRENDAPAADRPGVLGVGPSAVGVTLRLASGRSTVSAVAPGAEPPPTPE